MRVVQVYVFILPFSPNKHNYLFLKFFITYSKTSEYCNIFFILRNSSVQYKFWQAVIGQKHNKTMWFIITRHLFLTMWRHRPTSFEIKTHVKRKKQHIFCVEMKFYVSSIWVKLTDKPSVYKFFIAKIHLLSIFK